MCASSVDINEKLENKRVLKKENNLYGLNKIYENHEDKIIVTLLKSILDENLIEGKNINICICSNYSIPVNSLLFQGENDKEKDYLGFFLYEIFTYIYDKNRLYYYNLKG